MQKCKSRVFLFLAEVSKWRFLKWRILQIFRAIFHPFGSFILRSFYRLGFEGTPYRYKFTLCRFRFRLRFGSKSPMGHVAIFRMDIWTRSGSLSPAIYISHYGSFPLTDSDSCTSCISIFSTRICQCEHFHIAPKTIISRSRQCEHTVTAHYCSLKRSKVCWTYDVPTSNGSIEV